MTNPYDPCGKIYTILSEQWTSFLWFFEPVFIPQVFREHLVLVLGWTTGRRGYVSIAMITPNMPDGANPDHYIRIRAPRRRAVANESTVTLRKNKTFAALVEHSYVRLDWVWEVPFAILLDVPRVGMQLMLRAVSMEKIMSFYSMWEWDQAWGRTYQSGPECPQWAGYRHEQNHWGPPESIGHGGKGRYPQMAPQPFQRVSGLASSETVEQDEVTKYKALAGSVSTGSGNTAYGPVDGRDSRLEEGTPPCARQGMVYAGDAHCAALAKLLQEARQCPSSREVPIRI